MLYFCLEWINEFSTDQIFNYYNFATSQAIFKQNRLASSPECIGSQNMKIICSENVSDFKLMKIVHVVQYAYRQALRPRAGWGWGGWSGTGGTFQSPKYHPLIFKINHNMQNT